MTDVRRKVTERRLRNLNISPDVLYAYDEPHRFYHNWNHINHLLQLAEDDADGKISDDLFLAIIFHDYVYNVGGPAGENEELSALAALEHGASEAVATAIRETKDHRAKTDLGILLCSYDLDGLYDLETFIQNERLIFKEFQRYDYTDYVMGKLQFCAAYNLPQEHVDYVVNFKPNIAVFPGSFTPFHRGHYEILQKAEKIFDKVIIAQGKNGNKPRYKEYRELPSSLRYRQIEGYNGTLVKFIEGLDYDVTLVRGLRNSSDFEHELAMNRYMGDYLPTFQSVYIVSSAETSHISSSDIRNLDDIGADVKQYLIP